MESIHQRIKRLRENKGLSQEALANAVGVKYQSVQEWERKNGTAPTRKRVAAVAKALGVSVSTLISGETSGVAEPQQQYHHEAQNMARTAREEMLLELFRGLTPEQQREATIKILATVQANRSIQKHLDKPLRTYSNEEVAAAYGIPSPSKARRGSAKPKREPGAAMGDFLDDD